MSNKTLKTLGIIGAVAGTAAVIAGIVAVRRKKKECEELFMMDEENECCGECDHGCCKCETGGECENCSRGVPGCECGEVDETESVIPDTAEIEIVAEEGAWED